MSARRYRNQWFSETATRPALFFLRSLVDSFAERIAWVGTRRGVSTSDPRYAPDQRASKRSWLHRAQPTDRAGIPDPEDEPTTWCRGTYGQGGHGRRPQLRSRARIRTCSGRYICLVVGTTTRGAERRNHGEQPKRPRKLRSQGPGRYCSEVSGIKKIQT